MSVHTLASMILMNWEISASVTCCRWIAYVKLMRAVLASEICCSHSLVIEVHIELVVLVVVVLRDDVVRIIKPSINQVDAAAQTNSRGRGSMMRNHSVHGVCLIVSVAIDVSIVSCYDLVEQRRVSLF